MKTTINSNGSKWAGQEQDTIETLIEVLGETPLDRSFEAYGNFAYKLEGAPGNVRFFGNFLHQSHVFNIDSDDQSVISRLTKAIRLNQKREDYLSQQKPKTRCHRPGASVKRQFATA